MADVITSATLSAAWDGTGTAVTGSFLTLSVNDLASIGVEITGTFTATVNLEVTMNGTTWFAPNCLNVDKSSGAATLTAAGRRLIQTAGYTALRARVNPYTSGAAVVSFAGAYAPV